MTRQPFKKPQPKIPEKYRIEQDSRYDNDRIIARSNPIIIFQVQPHCKFIKGQAQSYAVHYRHFPVMFGIGQIKGQKSRYGQKSNAEIQMMNMRSSYV